MFRSSFLIFAISMAVSHAGTIPMTGDQVVSAALHRLQSPAHHVIAPVDFSKVSVTEEIDSKGTVLERKEKSFVSRQGHLELSQIRINGEPISAVKLKKVRDAERERAEQLATISDYKRGDGWERYVTPENRDRFVFTLAGTETINNRTAYRVSFAPNPNLDSKHLMDRFVSHLLGTIWIDAEEFELVRLEVQLRSEISVLGGVAGALKKLSMSFVRTRLPDGNWVNISTDTDLEARRLVENLHVRTCSRSTDFQPRND